MIALDGKEMNTLIVKDSYQIFNVNHLIHLLAEQLDKPDEEAWLTSPDLQYAEGQMPLYRKPAQQCNFQNFSGEATGRCRFITGFYGFTQCLQNSTKYSTKL